MKVEPRAKSKWDEVLRMELYVLQKLQNDDHRFFCTLYDHDVIKEYS